jgi:alpha-glucan,water dikinase
MTETERITAKSGIELLLKKSVLDDTAEVVIQTEESRDCLLHWGLRQRPYGPWQVPLHPAWPEGSRAFDHSALQTPFIQKDGYSELVIRLGSSSGFRFISFVLFFPKEGKWDNNHGENYQIEIPWRGRGAIAESLPWPGRENLAHAIIEKEMNRNSWTLMHRFNLCYDLLDKVQHNNIPGLALIFVWLRFSAIRQLDWQRNYNTQPRELGHAMERLTIKLAARYAEEEAERGIIRLIMTTLGHGSNAQRVRDEVLNIMHRHHIKEISGHFMEEWHQKLHNNTTPDDVVICEAYLEFLRSDGNLDRFYERLEDSGVTKKILESYERPVKSHPDFIPHLKEALIRDFEHFLGILKEVHSGTDLGIAIQAARHTFDSEMHGLMDFIWHHQNEPSLPLLAGKITEARQHITRSLEGFPHKVRDLLFLDIALEEFLRTVLERKLSPQISGDDLVELVPLLLENICLSNNDSEARHCLNHWKRLKALPRFGREWSLHAEAVLDRVRRGLGSLTDNWYKLLQPEAEFLGKAFNADSWAISLFSEEVMRGCPAFALSLILRCLDPLLRKNADLGDWQLISRGVGIGEVNVTGSLKSVQGKSFEKPVILIADKITGDEEIPSGVSAIITPDVIDGLSHLAIRARNTGILFAVCYNHDVTEQLKSLTGHILRMKVGSANNIIFEESHEEIRAIKPQKLMVRAMTRHGFTAYAIPMRDFSEQTVGYKSTKLKGTHAKLPGWISIPASAALPFGVFEKVLSDEINKETAERYEELLGQIDNIEEKQRSEVLAELQKVILDLKAPDELVKSLTGVVKGEALSIPADWNDAWLCIKRVWGSKWNERAYLSRRANGILDEDLVMSVLIQEVVESDYCFVIHTVNPFTGDKDEVYAEAAPGLGETLAANYPGKALSFTCRKGSRELYLLSFPSKSIGLYGGGLIFRSDSNGEDLAHYAGAGLYDSFVLPQPRRVTLDYTSDPLIWDEGFRHQLLFKIAEMGATVESIMEYPQDIEGAYSQGKYFIVQTRPQVGL